MDKGDALLGKKNWQGAYKQYQIAIKKFPDEGLFHTKKAMALMKGKKNTSALRAAQKGARLSPGVYLSQHVEGLLLMQKGHFKSAVDSFFRARRLLPQSPENTLYMAYCLERTGRKNQAVNLYRRAAGLSPGSWVAQKAYQRLNAMGAYRQ
jgi:Flp pilus assembly protein TadD